MRFTNVGKVFLPSGDVFRFDVDVTAQSAYTTSQPELNGLDGAFGRVNFDPDTETRLRVTVRPACASYDNCKLCDQLSDVAEQTACYALGCNCYGQTCSTQSCCTGTEKETKRTQYGCVGMDSNVTLPSEALVAFTVYDLDVGAAGNCIEKVRVVDSSYAKTPLRPASNSAISSTL